MRLVIGIFCLTFALAGCGTCQKPCVKGDDTAVVGPAKEFVSDTATVIGYVVPRPTAAGEKLIDTEKASLVKIKETPKTFTETSMFRKEGTK